MDGAIIGVLITAGLTITIALGAVYRSIRDKMDEVKDDISDKVDSKCDVINGSIIAQAAEIGELKGKVNATNGIRQACMQRFETIEHNITVIATSKPSKRKRKRTPDEV